MDSIKKQVKELMENQNHMLVAIKFLDERLKEFTDKLKGNEPDVKEILESQAMIDAMSVKNSDDIMCHEKIKEENAVAIKALEKEIIKLNEEIELTWRKVMDRNTKKGKMRSEIKCEKIFEKFNELEKHIKISAHADGGPHSRVCAHETLCSAPHRRERKFSGARVCRVTFKHLPQPLRSHI